MNKKIKEFQGQYRFLSNFYPSLIIVAVNGSCMKFSTVEHYYQAMKATNDADMLMIMHARTPGDAKRLSRKIKIRPDWQDISFDVMRTGLKAKFDQNPEILDKLLATGNAILEEGNRWHDTFWGVDLETGEGQNHLGKMLMEIRDSYKLAKCKP